MIWGCPSDGSLFTSIRGLIFIQAGLPLAGKMGLCYNGRMRLKLDGFGIFVDDMAKMIRFYRDVLGFEIAEDESTSNVFLKKDGTLFLLYGRADIEKMTRSRFSYAEKISGHFEIALGAENYAAVDEEFRRTVAAGAVPVMEPETMPWGQRTCYIADPEGNLVEIGSFVKD